MKCETAYLQSESEMRELIALFKKEKVRSYLEIGAKFGGSFWKIVNGMPTGSRAIAVDLPHGDKSFKESLPALQECVSALIDRGYATSLIIGDSTDPAIIKKVIEYGPYDACFIDANHTEKYIRSDWKFYGPLCRIVAFHDIGFYRQGGMPVGKKPIEVPKVWNEIKNGYRYEEIRHDKQDNGIGVLWRA